MQRLDNLLVQLIVLLSIAACSGSESFGEKSDWSALQGVEFDHRAHQLSAPIVVSVSDYRVVGLPRIDQPGNVWVLLNPSAAPLYKQLPAGAYSLSADQLEELDAADPAVLAQLQAHVRK